MNMRTYADNESRLYFSCTATLRSSPASKPHCWPIYPGLRLRHNTSPQAALAKIAP